jgi:hypothetical protein
MQATTGTVPPLADHSVNEQAEAGSSVPASPAADADTITCPLTGEKIPQCCCPLEK